jgi:isopentenyl-diphosphate delta-isomerase
MNADLLILVDEQDNEIGSIDKAEAHAKGLLHPAFSIFIFNSQGEFLLQQRAFNKYHSSGLWSNTCCSHPRPGEEIAEAANRRLFEEMGMRCKLTRAFSFIYSSNVGNGMMEHELDHVFLGVSDDVPQINILEVAGWKYLDFEKLSYEILQYPNLFSEWFKICINKYAADIMPHENSM